MFDVALTPAVTLPVIVLLTIALVVSITIYERRLRDQGTKYKIASLNILKVIIVAAEKEMERRSNRAIEFTFDTLRKIGWDKLARNEVTFEDVMFGARPRDSFSLADLDDALRGGGASAKFDPNRVGGGSGLDHGQAPSVDDYIADAQGVRKAVEDAAGLEGAGLGDKGQRPYHTAKMSGEPDFANRSPRAG